MNQPSPSHNMPEYSVSEISGVIKQQIEDRFGYVRVRGELSGLKIASSGHAYFKLKDDKSILDGVCWRGNVAKLNFKPEDGLEIVAQGRLTTYPGRSTYQIVVDRMEPAGEGALMALLEERKKQLAKEGLFEEARKKPLPFLPQTIGVITSPTGAVIRDILHRLEERFPVRVLLWPVLVQGEGAAEQIAEAIQGFNTLNEVTRNEASRPSEPSAHEVPPHERAVGELGGIDLIIVARGGGSIEDLWSFNEENVVRAAAASTIPLISAVGHETDTTLIDYASDRRAPTPTAAAEMVVPVRADLSIMVDEHELRLKRLMQQLLEQKQLKLDAEIGKMPRPAHLMELSQQRLDSAIERFDKSLPELLSRKSEQLISLAARLGPNLLNKDVSIGAERLSALEQRATRAVKMLWKYKRDRLNEQLRLLSSVSHESVLKRGFALVQGEDGKLISSAEKARSTPHMQLQFADGVTNVVLEKKASQ